MKKVENGGEVGESFHWLVHGLLKMPTGVQKIIAIQGQAVVTRAIKHHIYGMSQATCGLCDAPEYIDHLLSGCLSMIQLLRLFIGLSLGGLALLFQHTIWNYVP